MNKKGFILIALISILILVSCSNDEQYLTCESNIDSIETEEPALCDVVTADSSNEGKFVTGVLFARNEGSKEYKFKDVSSSTDISVPSKDSFYLYYLGNSPITTGLGVNCNYVLLIPSVIYDVFQETTGRRDANAAFWWYAYTYFNNIKPNSAANWNSLLSKLLNNKNSLPYPQARDIPGNQRSNYPKLDIIIPWSSGYYNEESQVFRYEDGLLYPPVQIIDAFYNGLGDGSKGYAAALVWYLNTYYPSDFPTRKSVYNTFLSASNDRNGGNRLFDFLKVNTSFTDMKEPSSAHVPDELKVTLYTPSEYTAQTEVKKLTAGNKIALQEVTSIGYSAYTTTGTNLYYSYELNPAGFISGVTIYYPQSVISSQSEDEILQALAANFAAKGAKTVNGSSAAEDFSWIDFFTLENAVKMDGVEITKRQ